MSLKILLLFLGLSWAIGADGQDTIKSLDLRLLQQINHAPATADNQWLGVSKSLNYSALGIPVIMEITGFATHNNQLKNNGIGTGASVIASSLIAYSLKNIFKRQRPYLAYPKLITGKSSESSYSFPSGHSSAAFALATA